MLKVLYIVVCSDFWPEGVVLVRGSSFFLRGCIFLRRTFRDLLIFFEKKAWRTNTILYYRGTRNTKLYLFDRSFLRKNILKVRD